MKRIIITVLLLIITLSGCTDGDKTNLAVFIENYNRLSNEQIDFKNIYREKDTDNTEYDFFIGEEANGILVSVKETEKEISECRITLAKTDAALNMKETDDKLKASFIKAVKEISYAFTGNNSDDFDIFIDKITDNFDVAEKTDIFHNYQLIFISNEICVEFIIRDKRFYEDETTVKPDNINSFLNTAPIRTETVPHR